MKRLILNRIMTPDGTILTSYHHYDYKSHLDKNGYMYSIDGGLNNIGWITSPSTKRNWFERKIVEPLFGYNDPLAHTSLCVYSDAPFEIIRKSLYWGVNMDKDKNILPETIYKPICELKSGHLRAILKEERGSDWVRDFMKQELKFRRNRIASKK